MTGNGDTPWWASGTGPGEGLGDEDPLTAHRAGRRAAGDAPTGPDGGAGDGVPPGTGDRVWWEEAMQALTSLARAAGHVRPDGDASADATHEPAATGELCDVCPVCVGLRALERSRPEMAAHLTEALRHVTLAVRSVVDGQAQERGAGDGGLERIDLDDE